MNYLRIEEVIDFHDMLIAKYGGAFGLRDLALLSSAISMPKQSYDGKELHQTPYEKGAAYFYHLIKNHPFIDGNKRTGVFVLLLFLKRNNMQCNLDDQTLEDLAVKIANNEITKTQLVSYLVKT